MNRFFVSFAAILASGIFAYSYLKEWFDYNVLNKELILKPSETIDYPYFHQSESLYLKVIMVFGLYFLIICFLSILLTFRQKWGVVYICFVMTMLGILGVMINGAIK